MTQMSVAELIRTKRRLVDDAVRFATAERATWELAYDASGAAATDYGVRAAPQTVLIDRRGVIVERWYGRPSAARLDAGARRLLASP